jgi:hypothetical protein
VQGGSRHPYAYVGDIIVGTVKSAIPGAAVKRPGRESGRRSLLAADDASRRVDHQIRRERVRHH